MVPYILSEFSSVFGTLCRFAFAEAPYAPLKFIFKIGDKNIYKKFVIVALKFFFL